MASEERDQDQEQASVLAGCYLNGYEVLDLAVGVNAHGEVALTIQRDYGGEAPQFLILTLPAAGLFCEAVKIAIELAKRRDGAA